MPRNLNENILTEQPVIDWFKQLGYEHKKINYVRKKAKELLKKAKQKAHH